MEKYEIIRSGRKSVSIEIRDGDHVIVRAPQRMSDLEIRRLVDAKAGWIAKRLGMFERRQNCVEPAFTAAQLHEFANKAKRDIPLRVARYAALMGVSYGKITIRAQKTRWGSCSAKGNLNFNCLLMLCPEETRDYVVAHELCHRKEMNHSARFWMEVARIFPEYDVQRRWLKENGTALIRRLG